MYQLPGFCFWVSPFLFYLSLLIQWTNIKHVQPKLTDHTFVSANFPQQAKLSPLHTNEQKPTAILGLRGQQTR